MRELPVSALFVLLSFSGWALPSAATDDAARNSLRAYGITTPAEQDAVAQHLGSRYGARIPRGEPQGLSAAVPTLLHLFNGGRGANEDLVRRRDAAPQDGAED